MRHGISIRAATPGDVDGVVAIERAVAEAPHWGTAEYRAIVAEGQSDGRRRLLVAEEGGALVGFAVGKVVLAAEMAELESVAVLPCARRLGLGRALCEAVIEWCSGQGASTIELEVRSASRGAIALYEGLGFIVEGLRRGYYREPPDDAVLMRLNIDDCG